MAQAISRRLGHVSGRIAVTGKPPMAMSPASPSMNSTEDNASLDTVFSSDVLPAPGTPTTRILGPRGSARRSGAVRTRKAVTGTPLRARGRSGGAPSRGARLYVERRRPERPCGFLRKCYDDVRSQGVFLPRIV